MAANNQTTAPKAVIPEKAEEPPRPGLLGSHATQEPGATRESDLVSTNLLHPGSPVTIESETIKQPEPAKSPVPNVGIQVPDSSVTKQEPLKQDEHLIKDLKPPSFEEGSASLASVQAIPTSQISDPDREHEIPVSDERLATEEYHSLSSDSSQSRQSDRNGTGSSAASHALSPSEATAGSPSEPDFRDYNITHLASTDNEDQQMQEVPGSTMHTLLSHLAESDPYPGLEIFFLPPIHTEASNTTMIKDDNELCSRLSVGLNVDRHFFSQKAWNANGFFQCQQGESGSQSSASRFLVKMLPTANFDSAVAIANYQWAYLSFCTLWRGVGEGKASCILVCFDDCSQRELKFKIIDAFNNYPLQRIYESGSAVNDALLRGLTDVYDNALWRFRDPVRDIEKRRREFAKQVEGMLQLSLSTGNGILDRYTNMHELSRHVIHINETLQVAANTTHAMVVHAQSLIHTESPLHQTRSDNVISGLRHSHDFLLNLMLRSKAFTDRINNEIALAYNIVSTHQLQNTKRIQEQSRDEGKDMTRIVTFLSLLFVPVTVAQGFWSMRFIVLDEPSSQVSLTQDAWKFAATAVCLVVISVLPWMAVHYGGWKPSIRMWLQSDSILWTRSKGVGRGLPR